MPNFACRWCNCARSSMEYTRLTILPTCDTARHGSRRARQCLLIVLCVFCRISYLNVCQLVQLLRNVRPAGAIPAYLRH
jgi:hypothetical protein